MDLKQGSDRIRLFAARLKYKREKHFYLSLIILVVFVSFFSVSVYFYQKNQITRRDNILESLLVQTEEDSSKTDGSTYKTGPLHTGKDQEESVQGSSTSRFLEIIVYVCGQVKDPGVYTLKDNARISDLLEMCGGATEEASLEAVNLAKKLNDGDKVYIPSSAEVDGLDIFSQDFGNGIGQGDTYQENSTKLVNINTSSSEELQLLPGIGEQTAAKIIDYRNKFGFFRSKEDIMNVAGIGEKKFAQIRDLISV